MKSERCFKLQLFCFSLNEISEISLLHQQKEMKCHQYDGFHKRYMKNFRAPGESLVWMTKAWTSAMTEACGDEVREDGGLDERVTAWIDSPRTMMAWEDLRGSSNKQLVSVPASNSLSSCAEDTDQRGSLGICLVVLDERQPRVYWRLRERRQMD